MTNQCADLRTTLEAVVRVLTPTQVYLFSVKKSERDDCITDFDLGVVTPLIRQDGDRMALTKALYEAIDTETPFDLFLYSPEEWETLTKDEGTFASRIKRKGIRIDENQ